MSFRLLRLCNLLTCGFGSRINVHLQELVSKACMLNENVRICNQEFTLKALVKLI